MDQPYLLVADQLPDFPLDESIHVTTRESDSGNFLVANSPTVHAHIIAPEIDYYLRNSLDSSGDKIHNIPLLYEVRTLVFDLGQDIDYEQEVGQKVLIVAEELPPGLIEELSRQGFTPLDLHPGEITGVEGHIGALRVSTAKRLRTSLETDQILWYDAPDFAMKQSGVYDAKELGWEEALRCLQENSRRYRYKNFLLYDANICQYHERPLKETCGKCEEVCPTVAILKIDEERHLKFDPINCHGCGGCVSVCPSGALDFSQMPRMAFAEAARYYAGHTVLLIPSELDVPPMPLKAGILPMGLEGRKFLDEVRLLTLVQESGNAVIFYTDIVSKGTAEAVRMLNEIFRRKYGKQAVWLCQNAEELREAIEKAESIEECRYSINEEGMKKREIFTYRMAHLVGDEDLGILETGPHIHYGSLRINEAACTLCMSCVGVCNVAALTAHPEDNTLKFNASLCTDCGYCETACPEANCLEVIRDTFALAPSSFVKRTMARDELFRCVECGKEFATVKSIEKIAAMMAPRFGDDQAKIRALYCCADCKPKVMLGDYLKRMEQA